MSETNLTLSLRQPHFDVFACVMRHVVLVAGRRWGKTTLAIWCLIVCAFRTDHALCYYVAPTYGQAERIAWSVLKGLVPPAARRRTSEQELLIELRNGSIIQLHGADHPDRLRGIGLDYVVLDEYADMKPDTWNLVIRPALSNRNGRALFIGTPRGRNHFYDIYCAAKSKPNWQTFRRPPRTAATFHLMSWRPRLAICILNSMRRSLALRSKIRRPGCTTVSTATRT